MNLIKFDLAKWKAGEHDGVYWLSESEPLSDMVHFQNCKDGYDFAAVMRNGVIGTFKAEALRLRMPEPKLVERWAVLKPSGEGIGWATEIGARSWLPQGYSIAHIIYDPATGKGTIEKVAP